LSGEPVLEMAGVVGEVDIDAVVVGMGAERAA
jgi:hypothetical protein